jgi:hypothetical protein
MPRIVYLVVAFAMVVCVDFFEYNDGNVHIIIYGVRSVKQST